MEKIWTPIGKLAWHNLETPKKKSSADGSTWDEFSMSLLIPKTKGCIAHMAGADMDSWLKKCDEFVKNFNKTVEEAKKQIGAKGKFHNPLIDGEGKGWGVDDFYILRLKSNYKPHMFGPVGKKRIEEFTPDETKELSLYDGCWVRVQMAGKPYTFTDRTTNMKNYGYTAYVTVIQKAYNDSPSITSNSDEEIEDIPQLTDGDTLE